MRQAIEAQRRQAPHAAVPSAPNTQMPQTRSGVIYNTQYGTYIHTLILTHATRGNVCTIRVEELRVAVCDATYGFKKVEISSLNVLTTKT